MSKRSKKSHTRTGGQRKYVIAFVLIAIFILAVVILSRLVTTRANEVPVATAEASLVSEVASTNSAALPAEITAAQAAQMQSEGSFILDVRQPDEWVEGHIEGAILIPLDVLEYRFNEIPKDSEIVVVCRSGNRSAQGRDILLANGFTQVTSMAGGMNAWIADGLPVVTGN
jgi:rhodanese-related sulfurtransferase